MSLAYDSHIRDHKDAVMKAYGMLCDIFDKHDVFNRFDIDRYELEDQLKHHDDSKMTDDKYFFGGNENYQVLKEFNCAWLFHIHHNPHHWQYWVLFHDDSNEFNPLEMQDKYIVEMICDWWSFSVLKDDLREIFDWYEEHKDIMLLASNTRDKVEYILGLIDEEIKNGEKEPKPNYKVMLFSAIEQLKLEYDKLKNMRIHNIKNTFITNDGMYSTFVPLYGCDEIREQELKVRDCYIEATRLKGLLEKEKEDD